MESHDVTITKVNEVHIRVDCERSIAQEISDHFTFLVPGHTFIPAYRKRLWDGKIRLYNVMNRMLYYGLLKHLCKFLYLREYTVKFESDFEVKKCELSADFLASLKIPHNLRSYQLEAVNHALSNNYIVFRSSK